ncbi:hypothetical protein [Alginatibacterium sediminis]|uniref:hypothetical protein n=1 Tax=Alginatibacterium sediminis TaxID=2164068 RepID=UPI0011C36299|nr:hypothetical protein [Alginatibacterium sediminis]
MTQQHVLIISVLIVLWSLLLFVAVTILETPAPANIRHQNVFLRFKAKLAAIGQRMVLLLVLALSVIVIMVSIRFVFIIL